MSSKMVMFSCPDDVRNFVKTVERFPFDMDLQKGRFIVDAKSLLGIMNLGFNSKIELKVHGEECQELFENIEQYVVA